MIHLGIIGAYIVIGIWTVVIGSTLVRHIVYGGLFPTPATKTTAAHSDLRAVSAGDCTSGAYTGYEGCKAIKSPGQCVYRTRADVDPRYGNQWIRCCDDGKWYAKSSNPLDPSAGYVDESACIAAGGASTAAPPATNPNTTLPGTVASCTSRGVKTGYGPAQPNGSCTNVAAVGKCVRRGYSGSDPHYANQWIRCCEDQYWYAKDSNSQDPAKGYQSQGECEGGGAAPAQTSTSGSAPPSSTLPSTAPSNPNSAGISSPGTSSSARSPSPRPSGKLKFDSNNTILTMEYESKYIAKLYIRKMNAGIWYCPIDGNPFTGSNFCDITSLVKNNLYDTAQLSAGDYLAAIVVQADNNYQSSRDCTGNPGRETYEFPCDRGGADHLSFKVPQPSGAAPAPAPGGATGGTTPAPGGATGGGATIPDKPTNLHAERVTTDPTKIKVTWGASSNATKILGDITYRIAYKTDTVDKWTYQDVTSKTEYVIQNTAQDKRYVILVNAYLGVQGSQYTDNVYVEPVVLKKDETNVQPAPTTYIRFKATSCQMDNTISVCPADMKIAITSENAYKKPIMVNDGGSCRVDGWYDSNNASNILPARPTDRVFRNFQLQVKATSGTVKSINLPSNSDNDIDCATHALQTTDGPLQLYKLVFYNSCLFSCDQEQKRMLDDVFRNVSNVILAAEISGSLKQVVAIEVIKPNAENSDTTAVYEVLFNNDIGFASSIMFRSLSTLKNNGSTYTAIEFGKALPNINLKRQ